jgi:fructose-bisphosphate aldolase class II
VPQDLLAIINQYGGKMKETYGVPVEEIQEAIKHGVRKINIDTDIRLAMTGAVRKFLAENPDKFDARVAEAGARGGQGDLQAALPGVRLRRPGREDQADGLAAVAQRYASGELAQTVV